MRKASSVLKGNVIYGLIVLIPMTIIFLLIAKIVEILEVFADQKTASPRALVQLFGPGSAVLGFFMEEHADGKMTVFIPASPALTVGAVHIVDRQRVTLLDAGLVEVADCITQWGVGAEKIIVANKA